MFVEPAIGDLKLNACFLFVNTNYIYTIPKLDLSMGMSHLQIHLYWIMELKGVTNK